MNRSANWGARRTHIHVLKDYIITQHARTEPGGVIALLENVRRCFPVTSVSAQLANQLIREINRLWHLGQLSRKTLILTAFPLLYESCVDLVNCRRKLADIFEESSSAYIFPIPRSRTRA